MSAQRRVTRARAWQVARAVAAAREAPRGARADEAVSPRGSARLAWPRPTQPRVRERGLLARRLTCGRAGTGGASAPAELHCGRRDRIQERPQPKALPSSPHPPHPLRAALKGLCATRPRLTRGGSAGCLARARTRRATCRAAVTSDLGGKGMGLSRLWRWRCDPLAPALALALLSGCFLYISPLSLDVSLLPLFFSSSSHLPPFLLSLAHSHGARARSARQTGPMTRG